MEHQAIDDPHYPLYHAAPPFGWMNDPNGLIYYRGAYHLFYQHNPHAPVWDRIHWGHMTSVDMLHWEHRPIALAPDEAYDAGGVFSGSAVESGGKLYLFYTGNVFTSPQGLPDDLLQQQCLAISGEGEHFVKSSRNPLIPAPELDAGQNNHFRDPKVWRQGDSWYMVVGTTRQRRGRVLLYRSPNLLDWTFVSTVKESDGLEGYMFECPDLFSLGEKEVLAVSAQGLDREPVNQASYFVGRFHPDKGSFEAESALQPLDYGFDYYAPQTFQDPSGRRIMIGWMPMKLESGSNKRWAGCMAVPRELSYEGEGRIAVRPIKELEALRTKSWQRDGFRIPANRVYRWEEVAGDALELLMEFDLDASTAEQLGLLVRLSPDGQERTELRYDRRERQLIFDRSRSGAGPAGTRSCPLGKDSGKLRLHVFLDRCTVEVFARDGECVLSGCILPGAASVGVALFAEGGEACVNALQAWKLA